MLRSRGKSAFVGRKALVMAMLGSAAAVGFCGTALAQDAAAASEEASDADNAAATIVITGTRIQGVAPVGAALTQLSNEDIKATGITSTADVLNTVPSVLQLGGGNAYAGGTSQQNSTLSSFAYNKSPNMRGFGFGATLSLVNSHRVPYEGANLNAFDGDNFPGQFLQRIDVVEDGGSALYGADAIAGTVNYIFRKPEKTLEFYAGYGDNEGKQDSYYVTGIAGFTWGDDTDMEGGFIASYQHSYQNYMMASARPDLYNDDMTAFGGAPSPLYATPGNVQFTTGGTTYYAAIPTGLDRALTLDDLGPQTSNSASSTLNRRNAWYGQSVIPKVNADRVAVNFEQHLTDGFRLFADGYYVVRHLSMLTGGGNSTMVSIPGTNIYSPCNPANYTGGVVTGGTQQMRDACAAGTFGAVYSSREIIGSNERVGDAKAYSYGGGLEADLPFGWTGTVQAYAGTYFEDVNAKAAIISSYIPFGPPGVWGDTFNFFCDANAFTCASDSNLAIMKTGVLDLRNHAQYDMEDYQINLNGPLFALPGGEVKAAVGAEIYKAKLTAGNNLSAPYGSDRTAKSVYGELYVPLVSPDMELGVIREMEVTAAVRYDTYSDAGATTNPRIGLNIWPTEGLKLFGNWGTSFRAPGLADNTPGAQSQAQRALYNGNLFTGVAAGGVNDPMSQYYVYATIGGGYQLEPETSTSWALGAELTPVSIPGLRVAVKYWNTTYENQVNVAAFSSGAVASLNGQLYNDATIYNPSLYPTMAANNPVAFFGYDTLIDSSIPSCAAALGQSASSQTVFDNMIACYNANGQAGGMSAAGTPTPANTDTILAVINGHRLNSGSTMAQGLDFNADYRFDTGMGKFTVGGLATYVLSWKTSVSPLAPVVENVNEFGYPQAFRARGWLQWNKEIGFGRWNAALFMNYANSYHIDPNKLPGSMSAAQKDQYSHIGSFTTFDLTLGFDTGDRGSVFTKGIGVVFSVQNLFNATPPLVVNQASTAGAGVRFDPTFASPLGRAFQIQVSKKF